MFFAPGFFGCFQVDGEIDQVLDFCRGVVQQFEEVAVFQVDGHVVILFKFELSGALTPTLSHRERGYEFPLPLGKG
ncbi:hypothetical protein D3C85_1865290 [compost metagenome]